MNKFQMFQNKIRRFAVNATWFVCNENHHEELDISFIKGFLEDHIEVLGQPIQVLATEQYWCHYYIYCPAAILVSLMAALSQNNHFNY